MDNNPFRSQNTNMYSSPMTGQSQQYPQTNAMPQTTTTNGFNNPAYTPLQQHQQQPFYNAGGYSNTSYPQQQQANTNFQTSYPQQQPSMYGQQQGSFQQSSYPQQQQPSFQQPSFQQQTSYQTYPQQQQQQQPFYWQAPQQQQQPQLQSYDPSTAFIPADFGLSSSTINNNQPQQQRQPQHPAVDASAYLKGNQVRKMECPVCHKTIEGDNMALNHHVNEHLEYDM